MPTEPTCLHLVLDRPPGASSARWVDAWKDACAARRIPDLRMFWIGRDQCRVSIAWRAGEEAHALSANLDAVADVIAACEAPSTTCPSPTRAIA